MEDGEGSNQRSHGNPKSLFSYFVDGVENSKTVTDVLGSFIMSESLDDKLIRLKRKLDFLEGKEEDINVELKYAESLSLKRRKKEVENWLKNVGHVKVKAHQAEQEVQGGKGKRILNFQLHQKLDGLTIEVNELHLQSVFPGGLTLEAQESRGIIFPATELVGAAFQENKQMILESLRDNDVLCIGIYGMGGAGKTTLLKHINNELVRTCPHISIHWVTVSQRFTINELQDKIATELKYNFECKDDEDKRAAELSNFLGKKKNLVLILDDVWEDILLDKVGIPVYVNGCKLILTTRYLDVCRKMECQKQIKVWSLYEKESWELFTSRLGNGMELTPDIEEVAKSLVKECAGLPLGIITMARSLKGVDDIFEWQNALENMRESKLGHDDMETKVFQVLKYSYDMLKDKKVQQCFLECSLYPEDFLIEKEVLIEQFIDEGLIDGMKSRQAKLYRGHTILNKLVNASLLEEIERLSGIKYVKMHDLVRDMALQITSDSPLFLVEAGRGLRSIPDEIYWREDVAKVSLMHNRISEIPLSFGSPKCPTLSTLLLNGNFSLRSISNEFFLHMKGLSVLDISETRIENLPESISELVNLSALLLRECGSLKYVPSLAKLTALKKLDLYESRRIQVLGMENLVKLRYLDLRFLVWPKQRIDLRMRGAELVQWGRLENLYCNFIDVHNFNTCVRTFQEREPTWYVIQLAPSDGSAGIGSKYDKTVVLWEVFVSRGGVAPLLPRCMEELQIYHSNLSLCDVILFKNVTNLRSCYIESSSGIEHLFSYSSSCTSSLQTIEQLCLLEVRDLRGLISGKQHLSSALPPVIFSSLKNLRIYECYDIKRLFINASLPSLKDVCVERCCDIKRLFINASLPSLESITVSNCDSLVEIISTTSNDEEEEENYQNEEGGADNIDVIVTLPKLLTVSLDWLISLRSIPVISDSLLKIKIFVCPGLKRIPLLDREPRPSYLQHVEIDDDSMESLEWHHPNAKHFTQSKNLWEEKKESKEEEVSEESEEEEESEE